MDSGRRLSLPRVESRHDHVATFGQHYIWRRVLPDGRAGPSQQRRGPCYLQRGSGYRGGELPVWQWILNFYHVRRLDLHDGSGLEFVSRVLGAYGQGDSLGSVT